MKLDYKIISFNPKFVTNIGSKIINFIHIMHIYTFILAVCLTMKNELYYYIHLIGFP